MHPTPLQLDLITIYGPTASGKTAIAVALARLLGAVIFSGDSRQVYRGMDIGSGKDLSEYCYGGIPIPYRMIDIAEAGEHYNLHRYIEDFFSAFEALPLEVPKILCGGTGLYITGVLGGYEMPQIPEDRALRKELASYSIEQLQEKLSILGGKLAETDRLNPRRLIRAIEMAQAGEEVESRQYPPLKGPIFCVNISRERRRNRISQRLKDRLNNGMIEEVQELLKRVPPKELIRYGLEYRYVTEYLLGHLTYEEMYSGLETAIHRFAKRQMTWARGMERKGYQLLYVTPKEGEGGAEETAEEMYQYIINNYK